MATMANGRVGPDKRPKTMNILPHASNTLDYTPSIFSDFLSFFWLMIERFKCKLCLRGSVEFRVHTGKLE